MGTKNNPGKFDCYTNALPDEPMFVLLARDPQAPRLLEVWAHTRQQSIDVGNSPKSDESMVQEALQCAFQMRKWREYNDGLWRNRTAVEAALKPTDETH